MEQLLREKSKDLAAVMHRHGLVADAEYPIDDIIQQLDLQLAVLKEEVVERVIKEC